MKSQIFINKYLLIFAVVSTSLIGQIAYADYNSVKITTDEMTQFYEAFISKEKADRSRQKKRLLLQQRNKKLAQARRYKVQNHKFRKPRQQSRVRPVYNSGRARARARVGRANRPLPAWRKSTAHTMTGSENNALFAIAKSRNLLRLKQLVAKGANIHHKNFDGESLLHIAASLGDMRMVQYLLGQGANVNVRTGKNWLPIHHAMRFNHPVVANYLIAHRAALGLRNTDGFTALDFAARSKNTRIKAIARQYGR
jgi:ankyrin repeat protein